MICPFCSIDMEPISLSGKTFCSNCGMTIYERPDLKVMPSVVKTTPDTPPKIKDVHMEVADTEFEGILDEGDEGTKPIAENTPNATDVANVQVTEPTKPAEPVEPMTNTEPTIQRLATTPQTPPVLAKTEPTIQSLASVPAPASAPKTEPTIQTLAASPATATPAPAPRPMSQPVVAAPSFSAPAPEPAQPAVTPDIPARPIPVETALASQTTTMPDGSIKIKPVIIPPKTEIPETKMANIEFPLPVNLESAQPESSTTEKPEEKLPGADEIISELADLEKETAAPELEPEVSKPVTAVPEQKPEPEPVTEKPLPTTPVTAEPIETKEEQKPSLVIHDRSHLGTRPVPKRTAVPRPATKKISPHKDVLELQSSLKKEPEPEKPVEEKKEELDLFVTKKGKEFDEQVKNIDTLGASGILLDILDDSAVEKEREQKLTSFHAAADVVDDIRVLGPEPEKPEVNEEPEEKPTLIDDLPEEDHPKKSTRKPAKSKKHKKEKKKEEPEEKKEEGKPNELFVDALAPEEVKKPEPDSTNRLPEEPKTESLPEEIPPVTENAGIPPGEAETPQKEEIPESVSEIPEETETGEIQTPEPVSLPHGNPMPQPLQPEEVEAMLARQNNATVEEKPEEEKPKAFPPSPSTPFQKMSSMPVVDPDKRSSNAITGYFKDIFSKK